MASSAEESDLDEEEDLIHSRSANFERDANLHGTSYAKWKREMLKEMGEEENDEYDDDINEVDEFWIIFMTMIRRLFFANTLEGDYKNASIFVKKCVQDLFL